MNIKDRVADEIIIYIAKQLSDVNNRIITNKYIINKKSEENRQLKKLRNQLNSIKSKFKK